MTTLEQIELMRQGVSYRHPVTIRNLTVHLRPLSISETIEVANTVVNQLENMQPNQRNALIEHVILSKETLVKASTSEPGALDGKLSHLILDRFTNEELHYIYKQYAAILDKCNPVLEEMKSEELATMVDQLKKNPSQLIDLSFLDLVNIARFLMTSSD